MRSRRTGPHVSLRGTRTYFGDAAARRRRGLDARMGPPNAALVCTVRTVLRDRGSAGT